MSVDLLQVFKLKFYSTDLYIYNYIVTVIYEKEFLVKFYNYQLENKKYL